MTFGQQLRQWQFDKAAAESTRITRSGVAKVLGITYQYLYMLEKDACRPSVELAKRIADYYGLGVGITIFAARRYGQQLDEIAENCPTAIEEWLQERRT